MQCLDQHNGHITLQIDRFEYHAAVSEPYTLKVHCYLNEKQQQNITQLVPLQFIRMPYSNGSGVQAKSFSGVLVAHEYEYDAVKNRYCHCLVIRPRLWRLKHARTIQIEPDQSIEQRIKTIFDLASRYQVVEYELQLSQAFITQTQPVVAIQYAATDFDYFEALCSVGMLYYFKQTSEGDVLVLTDNASLCPKANSLSYTATHAALKHDDSPRAFEQTIRQRWQPQKSAIRFYQPSQSVQSLAALTSESPVTLEEYRLPISSSQQAAVAAVVQIGMQSGQFSENFSSAYSGIDIGQLVQNPKQENSIVRRITLQADFSQNHWQFDTELHTAPLQKGAWFPPNFNLPELPGVLFASTLLPTQQVQQDGRYRLSFGAAFTAQQPNNPSVVFRDIQRTATQSGGSSHSTSMAAEVVLDSLNGAAYQWLMAGSLDTSAVKSQVTVATEQQTGLSNDGGLSLQLTRRRANQPVASIHMGLTDQAGNASFWRHGAWQMPDGNYRFGQQQHSTGFAKHVVMGNALTQLQNTYQWQHEGVDGAHGVSEQGVFDTYQDQYYCQPLAQALQTTPAASIAGFSVSYNPDHAQVLIAWQLQPKSLIVQSGTLTWQQTSPPQNNAKPQSGSSAILVKQQAISIQQLLENQTYQGSLELQFNNGQSLTQTIDWRVLAWLLYWQVSFEIVQQQFTVQLGWNLQPELSAQIDHYQVSASNITGALMVPNYKKGVKIIELSPETTYKVNFIAVLKSGGQKQAQFIFTTPALNAQNNASKDVPLGYQRKMSTGQIQEIWNIDQSNYHITHAQPQAAHHSDGHVFNESERISTDALIASAGLSYINAFLRDHVLGSVSYAIAQAAGPGLGSTTPTQYSQTHLGNLLLQHLGSTQVLRKTNSYQASVASPLISSVHQGIRHTVLKGQSYLLKSEAYQQTASQFLLTRGKLVQQSKVLKETVSQVSASAGSGVAAANLSQSKSKIGADATTIKIIAGKVINFC